MTAPRRQATLSLVVITRDEERHIGRCLASVSGLADQLVVVDSGSTDRTREIARAAGAELWEQEFLGYGPQKQLALERATGDWVLCLDADEWLDAAARSAVERLLRDPPPDEVTGFRLRLRTFYLGRWVEHCGWLNEWKLRLVRRGCARWTAEPVHETLVPTRGRQASLTGRILHFPYRDLGHQLQTIDRYTELVAIRDRDTPRTRVWFGMLVEPPLVVLQKYFLQLGVLDGSRGLIGAVLMAYYFFLRYARIRERQGAWSRREPEPEDEPKPRGPSTGPGE